MNTPQPGTWHHAQEIYPLSAGIERCKQKIRELLCIHTDPVIVHIAGGSASGKTSKVTKSLAEDTGFQPDTIILSMDDYYRGASWIEEQLKEGKEYNFDQPEALNMAKIQSHLMALRQGKSIQKPIYCMKSSEPIGTTTIHPARLILMEGLFALSDELPTKGDINIFVQASTTTRLIRRVHRDTSRTNQDVESIVGYFEHYVEPMHQKHIEPTSLNADIVLQNELGNTEMVDAQKNRHIERYLERDFCRKLRESTQK